MPSKLLLESLTTNTTDNNNANNTPIRQALVIIEHKIRNLEKRKTKLESYRAIQSSGKELSNDQKSAVAKFDEVAQSLEFARDLSKQIVQLANSSEKDEKKKARKDAAVRAQAETTKIREVLTLQNIMSSLEDETIRNDFLCGTNGAIKLEESDFEHLAKLFSEIQVNRQTTPYEETFNVRAHRAAEHLSLTIDGRPKAFGASSYEYLKEVIQKIQDCGYLDRAGKLNDDDGTTETIQILAADDDSNENVNEQTDNADTETESNVQAGDVGGEIQSDSIESFEDGQQQLPQQIPQTMTVPLSTPTGHDLPLFEAPSAAAVPAPSFPQQPQPGIINQQQQIPQQHLQRQPPPPQQISNSINIQGQQLPPPQQAQVIGGIGGAPPPPNQLQHPGHFPPTTVRAVESLFRQRQYIQQQIRPIAEVIGGGKFFFLQDSELDSPDMLVGVPQTTGAFSSQNLDGGQQQQPTTTTIQQQQQQPQQSQSIIAATIPTQTFTNQSFPPIVPQQPSQVQPIYSSAQPPQQHQIVVQQNVDIQAQQQHPVQPQLTQLQQMPVFSAQQITGIPPQMIPIVAAGTSHHQQPKLPQQLKQQSSTGTPTSLINTSGVNSLSVIDAQQQAAAIAASLQQQQQQQSGNVITVGPPPGVGNQIGFQTNKFPTNTAQSVGGQQHQLEDSFSTLRIVDQQKTQKNDLKDNRQQQQKNSIKDITSGATSEWRDNNDTKQRHHKTSSHHHHSHHHNPTSSTHIHSTSSHNDTGSGGGGGGSGGGNGNESNQWSNEMHTNSQQQSSGTTSSTTTVATSSSSQTNNNNNNNNKNNDWSSTFDSNQTESNHWNNNDAGGYNGRGNGGNRQSFGGRNRGSGGIRGSNNGGSGGSSAPSNGYRGRSSYSSTTPSQSQQQSNGGGGGGRNSGSTANGVYFRNNDNYYQNGGGFNGSKDRSNRYSTGDGSGGNVSSRGPPNSVNAGAPQRSNQNRSNVGGNGGSSGGGGGGMGPRGNLTGGNRTTSGGNAGYSTRPTRQQQDVNV